MGGTSTDVAMVRGAEPAVSNEIEIEYAMPIHVPMVDVRTVGAGGGSIARVNAAGLLEVGPESAGADPGPICYGRGGALPTISDANLLLGRLDPAKLAVTGGVTRDAVAEVFARLLGAPLGVDAEGAAAAVIRLANTKMAGAIRMVSLSLGADPRDYAIFAFGGAGPLHAVALARELGVPRVLVPVRPGITNALGCMVADLRHDYVRTINAPLDMVDMNAVHALFAEQAAAGRAALAEETIAIRDVQASYSVDMQFVGQSHVVRVDLEDGRPTRDVLRARFEEVYWARFKVELAEIRARIVNLNCSVVGVSDPLDLSRLVDAGARKAVAVPHGARAVFFEEGVMETPIYWRDHLPLDAVVAGPAVIEQMDTTVLIEPGWVARGDALGNLVVDREG